MGIFFFRIFTVTILKKKKKKKKKNTTIIEDIAKKIRVPSRKKNIYPAPILHPRHQMLCDGRAINVLYCTASSFIVRTLNEGKKDMGRRATHV